LANLKEINIDYGNLKSFIKILKFGNYNHSILELSYVVNFNLVGGKEYINFVLAPSNLLHSLPDKPTSSPCVKLHSRLQTNLQKKLLSTSHILYFLQGKMVQKQEHVKT
jgi:hypothetical protein